MIHTIGTTRNSVEVFVDLVRSEAAPYIAKEPQLLSLAKEALASTRLIHDTAVIECDMGRLVGYDFIVTPSNDEPVFYACILHDKVYTRFVKKVNRLLRSI